MRRYVPTILAAAGLVALAAASDARGPIPAATPVGKAESCIPIRSIRESRVRSDSIIDFVMVGRRVYRNTLPNGCINLGFEERFTYTTSLSQLCSNDIITVLQGPGLRTGASCGLGQFQPVTLATR